MDFGFQCIFVDVFYVNLSRHILHFEPADFLQMQEFVDMPSYKMYILIISLLHIKFKKWLVNPNVMATYMNFTFPEEYMYGHRLLPASYCLIGPLCIFLVKVCVSLVIYEHRLQGFTVLKHLFSYRYSCTVNSIFQTNKPKEDCNFVAIFVHVPRPGIGLHSMGQFHSCH